MRRMKIVIGCIFIQNHIQAYAENLMTLQRLLVSGGFRCTVGSPELAEHGSIAGLSGPLDTDLVELIKIDGNETITVAGEVPDLILLNNDLTGREKLLD